MKILLISTYDKGGAGNACLRLHQGLLKKNINSKVLLLKKQTNIPETYKFEVIGRSLKDKIKRRLKIQYIKKSYKTIQNYKPEGFDRFSIPYSIYDLHNHQLVKEADIINLHWVADFIDYKTFFKNINKPIVWTLHDMNPFTGGCHYSTGCIFYEDNCGNCPQLNQNINKHLSKQYLELKVKSLSDFHNLTIITPSKWLSDISQKSRLFKRFNHYAIPYGVNIRQLSDKPIDKSICKKILSLPNDKKIILFVVDYETKRKGLFYFLEAIKNIENRDDFILCIIGDKSPILSDKIVELGRIDDERLMTVVYNSADIFIIPSLEDNLPNTILESMACGTPVIGFDTGGIPEIVKDNYNGLVTTPKDVNDLSEKIKLLLDNDDIRIKFGKNARITVEENFTIDIQAEKYMKVFEKIIER